MSSITHKMVTKWTSVKGSRSHKQADATVRSTRRQSTEVLDTTLATTTPQDPITATLSRTHAMAAQDLNNRFFSLPQEIREEILLYAMLPLPELSTANIPNTPDTTRIPAVAQTCRSLRQEAMGVFFRSRPLEIALYSPSNQNLTKLWLTRWTQHARVFRDVAFTGTVTNGLCMYGSYKVRIVCTRGAGKYVVSVAPEAMPEARRAMEAMRSRLEEWLARRQLVAEESGFAGRELEVLVKLVLKEAGW